MIYGIPFRTLNGNYILNLVGSLYLNEYGVSILYGFSRVHPEAIPSHAGRRLTLFFAPIMVRAGHLPHETESENHVLEKT